MAHNGVLPHISAPMVRDLKAMIPEGFSIATAKAPKVDLDREIQRLLDGAGP